MGSGVKKMMGPNTFLVESICYLMQDGLGCLQVWGRRGHTNCSALNTSRLDSCMEIAASSTMYRRSKGTHLSHGQYSLYAA